jgi:FkbM family methyltransferase
MRGRGSGMALRWQERFLFVLYRLKLALRRFGLERIPGVPAAYRYLKRRILPEGTVLVKTGDSFLYVDLADEVMTPTLLGKVRKRYELELFESLLRPGMVVLDVGANIGYFTVTSARRVGDSGRVYAFEPETHNFDLLLKNIDLNGLTNVAPVQKAISDREGSRTLFVSRYNLGSHSFAAENAPDSEARVEVETVTLDEFWQSSLGAGRVDLMKMDCQGAEALIVDGAQRLLAKNDLRILMECWPFGLKKMGCSAAHLVSKLESLGYTIRVLDEDARSMDPLDETALARFRAMEDSPGLHLGLLAEKLS